MSKIVGGGLRVEKRAKGKWWAISEPTDGTKSEYRGPFEKQGEAEAALLDLVRCDVSILEREGKWWVKATILDQSPLTDAGPFDSRLIAEAAYKEITAGIREMLGLRPTDNASVAGHFMQGVVTLATPQEPARDLNLRERPANLDERLERARKLNELATELGADDFDLLLAAWKRLDPEGRTHETLLLSHARAVLAWLQTEGPMVELRKLEDRLRNVAGVVSAMLQKGEEFVFLLANHGKGPNDPDAFCTHISSMDRRTVVNLLTEHVQKTKRLLESRS